MRCRQKTQKRQEKDNGMGTIKAHKEPKTIRKHMARKNTDQQRAKEYL